MELAAAAAPPVAVDNYGALPIDVLLDILLRLPADVVCRLQLVCRSWRSLTSDRLFTRAYASRQPPPHIVIARHRDDEAAEVRVVDMHGNTIKCVQIRQPIGPLSVHGDLLCASHDWGLTCVVTGVAVDVAVDHGTKINSASPYCVLGHVPATGEYKVLRIQADYLSRRYRQMCEVMTLGTGGEAGSWRPRTAPPVALNIEPGSSSWNVAVAAGLAYFLLHLGQEADSIAVFDLASEEWKPATLQGPLTCSLKASTDVDEPIQDEDWPFDYWHLRRRHPPQWYCCEPLTKRFQLARLGDSLVVVYCNAEDTSTELWFLEDMGDNTALRWSRRYTLVCTPFALGRTWTHNYFRTSADVQQYHYPLAVLDDGRILVWVDKTSALRAYDPETSAWTDLATLARGSVVGLLHGNLLC